MTNEQIIEALRRRGWNFELRQWIPQRHAMNGIVGMANLEHAEKKLRTNAEVFRGESLHELAYRKALLAEQDELKASLKEWLYEQFVSHSQGIPLPTDEVIRNHDALREIQAIDAELERLHNDALEELRNTKVEQVQNE